MSASTYDVIVIGLGGMGSAAAYQLARRGRRVLGLERHTPAHDKGSSHGKSRVIRQAYYEHPDYVPLLLRAYELWEQIERETGEKLLTITGGVMIGRPDGELVRGTLLSARTHGLKHEVLDAGEIHRRYPPMTPGEGIVGVSEKKAGFVHPERSVIAHLRRATELGAELRFEEPATSWRASSDRVSVTTPKGTYEAGNLVICPGAWAPELLADLKLPLTVERQVLYWFDPVGGVGSFQPDRFPIYAWEPEDNLLLYGFPHQPGEPPGGVKIAFFYKGEACTGDTIDRTVRDEEVRAMRDAIATRIPSLANGELLGTATCLYTLTPDHHFVIAQHPQHEPVIIASPCSGHGYKFCSVVGEILADMATEGRSRLLPAGLFAIDRFTCNSR
jgi:sarcosine oxidase